MIKYDKELIKILKLSEIEALNLSHQYVSTEHVILAILKEKNSLSSYFKDIEYNKYKKIIEENIPKDNINQIITYTPLLKKILISSIENKLISFKSFIIKLLQDENSLANTFLLMIGHDNIKISNSISHNIELKYINNISKNTNDEKIFGREKELNDLIEVLCRKNKSNAILIGEAGVGKTAIVEALAQKIKSDDVPLELKNKEIISVNMASLVSGTRYRGEFEEKLENLIKEFENNDNYILFIDEIHTLLGAGASEGSIDAANIFKPYLARNSIKCIGATTINEYNNSIKNDKALNRRFQIILINEPDTNETKKILLSTKKYYEKYHNVKINDKLIDEIIKLSKEYIPDKKEPDRSLDILDKACTKLKLSNNDFDVNNLLEKKKYYLKLNDYNKAKEFESKILKTKSKCKHLNINIIKSCYEINKVKSNLGFKIS